jgi:hypothetical protein
MIIVKIENNLKSWRCMKKLLKGGTTVTIEQWAHNVCKTVWLSEALLVYGDMTWTLLDATIGSLDELRKCLKSAFLLPRAAGQ